MWTQAGFHPETFRRERRGLDPVHRRAHDGDVSIRTILVAAFEQALIHPWIISAMCMLSVTCALSTMAIALRAGDPASS
jgi:hypothetical protein